MKKIVFLIDSMGVGGAQELLLTYLENTELRDVQLHLVQLTPSNVFEERIRRIGCKHNIIGPECVPSWKILNPYYFFKLVRLLKAIKPEALYVQLFASFLLGVPAGRLAGVRRVAYEINYLKTQAPFWWPWLLLSMSPLVKYFCMYHEESYRHFGLPDWKFKRLAGYVRFDQKDDSADNVVFSEEKLGPECCVSVGRLVREKGHQYAIEAVSLLRKDCPDIKLAIVGSGPYERALRALVKKLDMEGMVIFTGYVKNLNHLYAHAAVFLMGSPCETINVAARWALHCGIPVVKFAIPHSSEIIDLVSERCGLYAPYKSVAGLALKTGEVLSNKKLRVDMGERGKSCIQRMSSSLDVIREYDMMFRELLVTEKKECAE